MDPLSSLKQGLNTVEHLGESVANPLESVAGEALKAGEHVVDGTSNTIIPTEISELNPFTVAAGPANNLVGSLEDKLKAVLKSPFTDITQLLGNGATSGDGQVVGGSVEAILMQIAARDRARLTHKVFELKNLQAPGDGATEQQVNDYNTQKASLMADIQSLQEEIQQTTTMATNVEKSDNDTNMAIARNI